LRPPPANDILRHSIVITTLRELEMLTHGAIRYRLVVLVVAGIAVGGAQLVTAQAPVGGAPGGIKGELTSIRGEKPIAGAAVTVQWPGGGRRQVTGPEGEFEFAELAPGMYEINVRADGYKPRTNLQVAVVSGATSPVAVKMRARDGGPGEGVEAGPYLVLPVPVAETTAASLQDLLNQAHRDGYDLVTLVPSTGAAADTPPHHLLILRKRD